MNDSASGNGIPRKRLTLEQISNDSIEKYGFKHKGATSTDSTGATGKEKTGKEETYRTMIRRQRDKILYTGGFRRLQDKTQVMSATLTGDHRTRLTHTLEVEQIAISVADALGLNKDLVSAIALGHDVGHTPFGHAAERTLNEKLKGNGGFHHPIQSAKYLWEKYGKNLIQEIYEGILAHDSDMFTIDKQEAKKQLMWSGYCSKEDPNNPKDCIWFIKYLNKVPSTLEAQVVIWADKIAYITHDLEDFIRSPIYTAVIKAEKSNTNGSEDNGKTENKLCDLLSSLINEDLKSIDSFESRDLIREITTNLIETSAKIICAFNGLSQAEVKNETNKRLDKKTKDLKKRYLNSLIINFDKDFRDNYYKLREFLDEEYIFSSHVQRSDAKAQKIISSLYSEFTNNYKLTPLEIRKKIDNETQKLATECLRKSMMTDEQINEIIANNPKDIEKLLKSRIKSFDDYKNTKEKIIQRIVASYISTMTDTYAENMFCNLNSSKDNYSL